VGLSQEDQPVIRHNLVISALATAAVAMTAFAVSPADARDTKKDKQYVAQQSPGLDGRATGRARARGLESPQSAGGGIPTGTAICY
jgi:hypothetical protein